VTHKTRLAIIVLAAGQSSRLGQPKQKVKYHGQTLLHLQCQKAQCLSDDVFCVVGFEAKQMSDLVRAKFSAAQVTLVNNDKWQDGMSTSIAAGIRALPEDIDAVMVLLVDQWQLATSALQSMVQLWREKPHQILVAAQGVATQQGAQVYYTDFGPPVIFPRHCFSPLAVLTGSGGAKPVLQQYKKIVRPVNLPAAFIDLDTPQQLATLNACKQTFF
jgi:molybdenum cofactor cytidylyltransferase